MQYCQMFYLCSIFVCDVKLGGRDGVRHQGRYGGWKLRGDCL